MKLLMKFDPATGEKNPYPSEAEQYRAYHGSVAWLFNPYSGERRDARDVGSDVLGHLIAPQNTPFSIFGAPISLSYHNMRSVSSSVDDNLGMPCW